MQITVGSVCSGIEAASVAWMPLGFDFKWFSEVAAFPSSVLLERYPNIANLGDMNLIPDAIMREQIAAPDVICGGTPCQAFSLAGSKNGLNDKRGNLTLRFAEIIDVNDFIRSKKGLEPCLVFWENVEGVLTDKTNAFGCLISSLAGTDYSTRRTSWPNAGIVKGTKRNIAWRVLDAKYFGLPQQRRRLYMIACDKHINPEDILFEEQMHFTYEYPSSPLSFCKDSHSFEVFREYTDCLYSAYGTKWNGNAAAYNGSLFVIQDNRLRRFSPLECERLMGLPDHYTQLHNAKKTNRYTAIGNSWAVPVIKWIGQRLISSMTDKVDRHRQSNHIYNGIFECEGDSSSGEYYLHSCNDITFNCSAQPNTPAFKSMQEIVSPDAPESIYISPVGCHGILRRSRERNITINQSLYKILMRISSQMPYEEIERQSRIQRRGKHSEAWQYT